MSFRQTDLKLSSWKYFINLNKFEFSMNQVFEDYEIGWCNSPRRTGTFEPVVKFDLIPWYLLYPNIAMPSKIHKI